MGLLRVAVADIALPVYSQRIPGYQYLRTSTPILNTYLHLPITIVIFIIMPIANMCAHNQIISIYTEVCWLLRGNRRFGKATSLVLFCERRIEPAGEGTNARPLALGSGLTMLLLEVPLFVKDS